VFAGVDISYNEDSAGRWELHWQLQVYGVCVSVDVAEVTTLLARLYPANNTTPKPLRVRHCENLADALSYLIKPYFGRRVSYLDGTGRFNTRKRPTKEGAGARVGDLDRPIPTDNSLCPDRLSAIWGPDRANEISSNELGKSTRRQRTEKGARNGVHCKLDHIKCSVLSARLG